MAEVITGEFSKYSSGLIDAHVDHMFWLWDCGPEKPKPPERPEPPHGKEGNPEFDLAKIEFKEKLEDYEAALKAYARQKVEFSEWERRYGGPVEISMWSFNAKEALTHDQQAVAEGRQTRRRYYLSDRTKGQKLKNHGLPIGMKPGHGHQANLERQIAGEKEFVAALRSDPQFGMETQP